MANQLFYGSICLTDILEKAKGKRSAFTKAANGKIYVNINVWQNEEADKFGNSLSIQLNPSKEKKDTDEKTYIGNCKKSEGAKAISEKDADEITEAVNDLPF